MASATVKEFCSAWWAEVHQRIIGAVVFIDEPVSECLHWDGGMFSLMWSGAASVKLLLPYETCYSKKAVFITQGYASDMELIEKILKNGNVTHSILICTVSLDVVFMEISKDRNAREVVSSGQDPLKAEESLTNLLQKWMRVRKSDKDVHAQVVHMPIFTVSLTPAIFTTPHYTELCPLNDGNYIKDPINELRLLHKSDRKVLRRLACNLNSMLDSMNLKEDVFYIGNYSGMLAGILEYSPKYINRRKNSLQPVSLILVDRTLDLCGVASHSCDTVYDKMRMVLPTYEGWASECAINMSAICTAKATKHPTNVHISPGSIFTPDDDDSARTVDLMVYKTQDEVMLDVYNRLSKIDINKSPSPENLSKVTHQRMEKTISNFKGNYDVISKHIGPIQQGLALIQMHKSRRRPAMELLMNFEKQLLQSLATSRESTSVLTQISVLIKTRRQRDLPLENLLALLIQVYSLTGTEFPFVKSHELELMEALEGTFLEDDILEDMSPEDAKQNAKDIMSTLTDIKYMRKTLTKYRSLLKPSESGDGFEYRGLVQQLVDDLVDPSRPQIPDLQVRSDGLKHLLKTGLSMFNINKKEKHPMDYPTVIIYMIGGTTVEECRNLNRTVITSGVDNTVLFGTTTLLNAKDTANMYLFSV